MYRSSPLRSTMNRSVLTALGMCKVCTEAVHSVDENARTENAKARKRARGRNQPVNTKTRKPENGETGENAKARKRENGRNQPVNAKTRKPENGENAKTAKTARTAKTRKRENGENPKTRKRRERVNPKTAKAGKPCLLKQQNLQSIKLAIKSKTRGGGNNAKTRKRPKVFLFSGFLVFSFSGFLGFLVFLFRWPHPSGQVAFFMCLEKFLFLFV